jgi:hypothetical protein
LRHVIASHVLHIQRPGWSVSGRQVWRSSQIQQSWFDGAVLADTLFLIGQAWVKRAAGDIDGGTEDLVAAMELVPPDTVEAILAFITDGTLPAPAAGRRKGGLKRSVATEAAGIPLGIAAAGANRHDAPLLAPTLHAAISQLGGVLPEQRTCHLDAAYDGTPARHALAHLGFEGQIARLGIPAPIQATQRWPIERTNSWMNGYGKLRRMTDRNPAIVIFYLYLAAAFVTIRQLIQHARTRYRWDTRPTTKRLK